MEKHRQRAWVSWVFVGLLAVLCATLAVLQNRWISQVSEAQREHLRQELQAELNRLSREFNSEISRAWTGLLPSESQIEAQGQERAYEEQYRLWKDSHDHVFTRIALAKPEDGAITLETLNLETGKFAQTEWPAEWQRMHDQLLAHLRPEPHSEGGPGGPGRPPSQADTNVIDIPRFGPPHVPGMGGPHRTEQEWLLVELNPEYARTVMFPELMRRYLGGGGKLDYRAEVVSVADPSHIIFQSTAGEQGRIEGAPDASVNLFDVMYQPRSHPGEQGRRGGFGPPPAMADGRIGRWRLMVRHEAGSLEAVVDRARWQSVAISGALLLLILTTAAALVRLSRRSQQLAELQMNFVAGVSHELRTPLTVIRTAAFNLRGKIAARPEQVERYGELIQDESEKLARLVDQVLRFASASAGHVIRAKEPVAVSSLIDEGLRSSRAALSGPSLIIERRLPADLPLVMADELAMKHAIQNLVDNALKYGTEGSNWIGIFASTVHDQNGAAVEVRVVDRGPGIPEDEQAHIFDPFFRGRHAVQDQIHGTGLGLNLVKKIVEAHGGSITVNSEPMKGTEFVLRLPVAPPEFQDEFAHSIN